MNRDQITAAILRGAPFVIHMADGKEYPVPHPDYISVHPTASYVIVYHNRGGYVVLPLLTMTGISSNEPAQAG